MNPSSQLHLTLLGNRFKIACSEEDKPLMQEAAGIVECKCEELRSKTRVADSLRAALMTALQIAFEARKEEHAHPSVVDAEQRIDAMCAKIEAALARAPDSR